MKSFVAYFITGVLLLFSLNSFADTHIASGNVSGTWTLANSPYIIDGHITIQTTDSLIIEPGVEVIFSGHYKFNIGGRLLAIGTVTDSITFTSSDTSGYFNNTHTGWHSLGFISNNTNGQDSSKLIYCIIEFGKAGTGPTAADSMGGGIYCEYSSDLLIKNSSIQNNYAYYHGGGIYCLHSNIRIENTIIEENTAGYYYYSSPWNFIIGRGGGLYAFESDPQLVNDTFRQNISHHNGGGLCFNSNSDPLISNVGIYSNICEYANGGGIACMGNSNATIQHVDIRYNIADRQGITTTLGGSGGGIFLSGSDPIITDVTIHENRTTKTGGGIGCEEDSDPVITDVTIRANKATDGGGIYSYGASVSLTLVDVTITADSSENMGGGIDMALGALYLTNVLVDSNYCVRWGGGMAISNLSDVSFDNVTITRNYADENGGGLHAGIDSPLEISDVTITHNYADDLGGGLYINGSTGSFTDLIITDNTGDFRGGGVYVSNGHPKISHTIIGNNNTGSATYARGGGVYCYMGSVDLTNVTISENSSVSGGGIAHDFDSHTTLKNCISWNNTPEEILFQSADDSLTASYSDIEGGLPGIDTSSVGHVVWGAGNINSDPLFLNPSVNDFELTWTNYPTNDATKSPCIDTGDPSSPLDPDGSSADMGALYYYHGNHQKGIVSGTWYLANSPYIITGDLSLLAGYELYIEAGVEVIFMGHYAFNVYGRLMADGSESNRISFSPFIDTVGWHGIRFYNTTTNTQDSSYLRYCNFEYGKAVGSSATEEIGGAVYCFHSSDVEISHCLFTNNYAERNGGGIGCICSSIKIDNVTVSKNTAVLHGGAIYVSDSNVVVNNSIFWGNTAPEEIYTAYGGTLTANYSNIDFTSRSIWPGTGNINADPLFVDYASNNFNLSWDNYPLNDATKSPCIDSGDPSTPNDPDGSAADMGALYFNHYGTNVPSGSISGTWTSVGNPYLITDNISINSGNELTISQGVEVYFMGLYYFVVRGRLVAQGSPSDSILITAIDTATGWLGMEFINTETNGQDSSLMQYVIFEYGNFDPGADNENGGGLSFNNSSDSRVDHCLIHYNHAENGGGIYIDESDIIITNSTIDDNNADYDGGGIFMRYSDIIMSNVILSNNTSGSPGGGISLLGSDPILTGVTITANDAGNLGGGMYCYYNSDPSFTNVTVSYNTSGTSGGGIYCDDHSNPTYVCNIQINNNEAVSYGGGIYCKNTDDHTIYDVSFSNNTANYGGGIACYSTDPTLRSVELTDNTANINGGGLYCSNYCFIDIAQSQIHSNNATYDGGGAYFLTSHPDIDTTTFIDNTAGRGAGGIYFNGANAALNKVQISDNTASEKGGGIYCYNSSTLGLVDVSVFENIALEGGGIYCDQSTLNFSSANRCNLYSNRAGSGNDLYTTNFFLVNVTVDTFTVVTPYDYFAHPIESYTFNILNHVESQTAADLYVHPLSGSNSNSGLDAGNALKTITKALTIIQADAANHRTIHLAGGMYSYGFSGETYPLNCRRYVSLDGTDTGTTTLNAQDDNGVLYCDVDTNFSVTDLKIQNGNAGYGGGIYCKGGSNPSLDNLIITTNNASMDGGGIFLEYNCNPKITNTFIQSNTATSNGGGIGIQSADPVMKNIVIYDNHAGSSGGGMYVDMSFGASIFNLTLSGNTATGNGDGMFVNMGGFTMTNCIVRDSYYDPMGGYGGLNPTVNYSNILGGFAGTNNIDTDPLFANGPGGDLQLTGDSPCIDTGDPGTDTTGFHFDIAGNPRFLQANIDMGAFEYGIYWTGDISSDWLHAGNWSNDQVPDSSSRISILLPYTNPPVLNANAKCKNLWMEEGVEVTIQTGAILKIRDTE